MAAGLFNTAANLVGLQVGKWKVLKRVDHQASTGGHFSCGYIVEDTEGAPGFLKALDYSEAFEQGASVDLFKAKVDAYIFERDLMNECRNEHLKHVVTIVDSGRFEMPEEDAPENMFCPPVDYLVLEKADKSVRELIDLSQSFDIAWMLRSLHNVAVGIEELHSILVAHQDIKPSNVLLFEGLNESKIGDVGRSIAFNHPAAQDSLPHAGDNKYAPPELLYGVTISDWKTRRYSCDMYMFGNLIFTYFNNISLTIALMKCLPPVARPWEWRDSYDQVLPQIELAFSTCIEAFNKGVPSELMTELVTMIQQLCAPDYTKRGDLKRMHLGTMQYSLEKYISRLDYLARKYEFRLKRILL